MMNDEPRFTPRILSALGSHRLLVLRARSLDGGDAVDMSVKGQRGPELMKLTSRLSK